LLGTFRDSLEKPAKVIRDDGIAYEAFDDDVAMQQQQTRGQQRKGRQAERVTRRQGASASISCSPPPTAKRAATAGTGKKQAAPMSSTAISAQVQATIYYLFTASLYLLVVGVATDAWNLRGIVSVGGHSYAVVVPCAVAFGPIAFGIVLLKLFSDKHSIRWPFHKEASWAFALHFCVGFVVGVLPVYATLAVLLREPGYSGLAALSGGLVA
jgi:hypothetical protein